MFPSNCQKLQKMRQQGFRKIKSDPRISILQNNLFSKLSEIKKQQEKVRQNSMLSLQKQNDSLTQLINKAKNITTSNSDKIEKAKRTNYSGSTNDGSGTFLTGTGHFSEANSMKSIKSCVSMKESQIQYDDGDILKQLQAKEEKDDLEQLRKMIKQTNSNLLNYKKKVFQVKNDIMNYAEKINMKNSMISSFENKRLMKHI